MGRGHWHPAACRVCGKRRDDGHHITQRGFCVEHAKERVCDNLDAMHTMTGPLATHWRERMAASVGAVLLDGGPLSEQTASDA